VEEDARSLGAKPVRRPLAHGRREGRDPAGARPSTRRIRLAPLGGGADSPPPFEKGLRGAASPQQGQRYDARYHQRQASHQGY
jgi:hypothetical protein